MVATARRRYRRTALGLSVLYAVLLIGVSVFFKTGPRTGVSAYAAAVLPALPIIGVFYAIGRYLVEEQDEFLRMLMVRQILWATGIALSIATVWGFLESFNVVRHVDAYWVAVLWFGGLALGACINRLTLGSFGPC